MRHSKWIFLLILLETPIGLSQPQKQNHTIRFPESEWKIVDHVSDFGWSDRRLKIVEEYFDFIGSQSLMIIENGHVIASWGDVKKKFRIYSMRKSLLGMLFGPYMDSAVSLSATLSDYRIDDIHPSLEGVEKEATIKDLLTSTSGIYHKAASTDNIPPKRLSHRHGEYFYYNNWDFNALGTIFRERTGHDIFEDFSNKIAIPIGMQDYRWTKDREYRYIRESLHPAYHFDMTARDLARFGLLIQNHGVWKDQRIIPEKWIYESTSSKVKVTNEEEKGSYGYLWWIIDSDAIWKMSGFPENSFYAYGNWSQYIFILPSKELLIVHRGYKKNISYDKLILLFDLILKAKEL